MEQILQMMERLFAHQEMTDAKAEARQERMESQAAANPKELREDIKGNQEKKNDRDPAEKGRRYTRK
jgi:hypothetical protein